MISASKIGKIVSRVTPSNISSIPRRTQEKDEEIGLREVQAQQPRPGTSREAVISVIEEVQSTAVLKKEMDGESVSQSSIENGTRPVADPAPSSCLFRTTPPRTPQQQNDLDDDMDQMISEIMDSGDESKETLENKFKKLQKKATALREKKKSFDSENSSPPSSSVNKIVRPREESPPPQPSGTAAKRSPLQLPDDPDKIIALPDNAGGESGGGSGSALADVQKVNKKEAVSPSSSVRRRHRDHVSIEVGFSDEAAGNGGQRNPTYLETYLGYMFNCCMSPFRPEGSSGGIWGYCIQFCFLQVVIYWALTIVAILQTLAVTKYNSLKNIADGGLENFTRMSFYIMNSCLKIYSAYLFTVQQQHFAKMLRSWARLRDFAARNSNVEVAKYQTWKVALLAISSTVVSTVSIVFSAGLLEWTTEKGILEYSFIMALAAYVWTPAGASEQGTQIDLLFDEFGKNISQKKVVMGLIGFGIFLCHRLMANAMSDLVLTTSATIENEMDQFANDVGNPDHDIYPVTMENFEAVDGQWAHYQLLKQAMDDTNDTFDSLLRYIHVDNMMMLVYFVLKVFDGELSVATLLNIVYNIVKAGWTYRVAAKAASKNEIFLEWIRRLIWKSDDKTFTRRAHIILERMKVHPLGFGRGQFLIDENFLFRFVGASGSVFVLEAQTKDAAAAKA